jgi:hypothetical protein
MPKGRQSEQLKLLEEQDCCWMTTKLPQPYRPDGNEGNIRDHIPEIGYAE